MKKWIFVFFFVLHFFKIDAQKIISFSPVYFNHVIKKDSLYTNSKGDSIYFTTIKFYISDIKLINYSKTVWKETNSYHLIDFDDSTSMKFLLNTPLEFTKISFNIGIDSSTNSAGALGGSLDPTKGMYWTWQNGYINTKIEGRNSASKNNNNNGFSFHIGGYQYPFNSLQTLIFEVNNNKQPAFVIHLDQFFKQIDLSKQANIMSPGTEAVDLSKKFKNIFSMLN